MENKYLKKVSNSLDGFFCYFKDEDILVISEDKTLMPFAYLIVDELNYPGMFLLSLAVDYPMSDRAVHVALKANKIREVGLSEQFFVSQSGVTHMGDDAEKYYEIETDLPIEHIEPMSKDLH